MIAVALMTLGAALAALAAFRPRRRPRLPHPATDLREVYAVPEDVSRGAEELGRMRGAPGAPVYPPGRRWSGVWSRPYGDGLTDRFRDPGVRVPE